MSTRSAPRRLNPPHRPSRRLNRSKRPKSIDGPHRRAPGGNLPPGDARRRVPLSIEFVERDDLRDRCSVPAPSSTTTASGSTANGAIRPTTRLPTCCRDLLPMVDDLERALSVVRRLRRRRRTYGAAEGRGHGASPAHRLLPVTRASTPIETVGAMFDPGLHEAVVAQTRPDHRPEVPDHGEIRRGYRIGHRLLRASIVKVARS